MFKKKSNQSNKSVLIRLKQMDEHIYAVKKGSGIIFIVLPSKPDRTLLAPTFGQWGIALVERELLDKNRVWDKGLIDKYNILLSLEDRKDKAWLSLLNHYINMYNIIRKMENTKIIIDECSQMVSNAKG